MVARRLMLSTRVLQSRVGEGDENLMNTNIDDLRVYGLLCLREVFNIIADLQR